MLKKTIIQGKIEFGTEKSYSKALKMYIYRAENYHKSDIIFDHEDIFIEENYSLVIPRLVKQVPDKIFRNTTTLLEYCTQFAITGEINAWLLDEGKIISFKHFEPTSEKIAVQKYLKGSVLMGEKGREEDALVLLTTAIEKYDRHAQAYQKRAKVNAILERYHDAMRDFNKSIGLDDTNPHSYYGRAKIYMIEQDFEKAIDDFDLALKKSVALQEVYWKSRRLKALCHIKLKQYEPAIFDLKLFTNRAFTPDNVNYKWKGWAYYHYAMALIEIEDYDLSIDMLDKAYELIDGKITEADILKLRGKAKMNAGMNGHIKDLTDAANLGDQEAATLLASIS